MSGNLSIPRVRIKRTNRSAQINRIGEFKAAAKILKLGGSQGARVRQITDDDRRRLEAQLTIKRKREERDERRKKQKIEQQAKVDAKRAWKEKVKHITPVLVAAEKKTRMTKPIPLGKGEADGDMTAMPLYCNDAEEGLIFMIGCDEDHMTEAHAKEFEIVEERREKDFESSLDKVVTVSLVELMPHSL